MGGAVAAGAAGAGESAGSAGPSPESAWGRATFEVLRDEDGRPCDLRLCEASTFCASVLGEVPRLLRGRCLGEAEAFRSMTSRAVWLDRLLAVVTDGRPLRFHGGDTSGQALDVFAFPDGLSRVTAVVTPADDASTPIPATQPGALGRRYVQLLEDLGDGVWAIDAANRTTYVTPRLAQMLGYSPLELIGRRPSELMGDDGAQAARQTERACLDGSPRSVTCSVDRSSAGAAPSPLEVVPLLAEVEALLAGVRGLMTEDDFPTAAAALVDRGCQVLGAPWGYVSVREGDCERRLATVAGEAASLLGEIAEGVGPLTGLTRRVYESGESLCVNDYPGSGEAMALPAGHVELQSVLLAPLLIRGRAEGLLVFANKPGGFADRDIQVAKAFAELLAVALSSSRTRGALQESEERFRAYVTGAPFGLFVLDAQGRLIETNPAACRVMGYQSDELLTFGIRSLVHEESLAALDEMIRDLASEGFAQGDLRLVPKHGGSAYVAASAVRPYDGCYVVFFTDVSEHRRAEEALRESEEMVRAMLDQSLEGIAVADTDGTVLEWNPAQEKLTGLSREEVLGRPMWDVQLEVALPESRQEAVRQRARAGMMEALRTGRLPSGWSTDDRHEIQRRTGERRVMQSTVFPIRTARGYLLGSISRDVTEHVRAEQALRESEARYGQLFEEMPSGFQLVEMVSDDSGAARDYRFLQVNPAFERLTGLSAEAVVGRCAGEVLPNLDAHWVEALATVAEKREPAQLELCLEPLGRCFEVRAFSPRPGQVAALLTDISQRRLTEQALRESEAKFSRAFHDNSAMMVISTVAEGRFIDVNSAFFEGLGYSRDEVIGRTSAEIGLFALPAQRSELVHQFREHGVVRNHEILLCTKDRRLREGLFSATPMTVGGEQCWLSVVIDVTELKAAERALQRRAVQLERLLDTAQHLTASLDLREVLSVVAEQAHGLLQADSCALYLLNDDGRFLTPVVALHPQYASSILATPADVEVSLTGKAVRQRQALVFNDPSLEGLGQHLEGTPEHEPERIMVAPFIANDKVVGAMRVDRTGEPFTEDDLTLVRTFAAYAAAALENAQAHERLQQEIRERQHAEARLLQSQKMESVGRLAGGVAHDFNNILTAITGFVELVLDDLDPSAQARDDLKEVLRSAERATHLTRQLLAFSRRQAMEMRPVDLNALVGDLGRLLARLIGEQIELVLRPQPGLPLVQADPAQVEQVLLNLAVNARDAMPGGGRLTVATYAAPAGSRPEDLSESLPAGDCVCLEVTDTGTGMSEEVMAHLFEPFFTTKELGKGTGLGLATVYGIVRQHGGDIQVRSSPGEGSTFAVYLPALPAAAAPKAAAPSAADATHGGETVLLVEDEPVVRTVARRYLERLGYAVLEAGNGAEALQLVAAAGAAPSLLITDLVMPHMGGLELARRLRGYLPDLRVLYTSGYSNETDALVEATDGGDFYLQKPFDARTLALKVSEALGRR